MEASNIKELLKKEPLRLSNPLITKYNPEVINTLREGLLLRGINSQDATYSITTAALVKYFQREAGIKPDSVVGPETWSWLFPEVDRTTLGGDITYRALCQIAKNYVYGVEVKLEEPNPFSFDCSEMMEWLFYPYRSTLQKKLVDGAANQFAQCIPAVPDSQGRWPFEVGTLLFLGKRNGNAPPLIHHVGVFLGAYANNPELVIEAKGKDYGVIATTLTDWMHKPEFAGAKKVKGWNPNAPVSLLATNV